MAGPNWDAIETEYVTSAEGITYRQLAEKHGLNQATVSKWAKRREWVTKREAHRRHTASMAQAEIAKEQAEAILDARSELMETARILGERIRSGDMNPGTLDKAANAQVAVFKFLEVLGGNPDSITKQDVTHHGDLTLDEIEEAQEDLFVLALARRRSEREQRDGDGGGGD
jgi:hypothetical protein